MPTYLVGLAFAWVTFRFLLGCGLSFWFYYGGFLRVRPPAVLIHLWTTLPGCSADRIPLVARHGLLSCSVIWLFGSRVLYLQMP